MIYKLPVKNRKTRFAKTSDELINRVKDYEERNAVNTKHSWDEIEKRIPERRNNIRRKYLYIVSIAAAFILLISISYFITKSSGEPELLPLALLENELPADTGDIILTAKKEHIIIQDESDISYESDGKINVNDETLATVQPAPDKAAKEDEEIHQIYVPKGKRARTTFSDGTVMHINSDTRVIYPAVFARNKREIIVEGEVFLDVTPDETSPFIVKTNGFDVMVLGTRFNVNSYKDDAAATVTLVSGAVEVKTPGHQNIILAPNQLFKKTSEVVNIQEVDVYEHICWIENIMLLRGNRNAGQIFQSLMRSYGKTIIYDERIAEIPISGKLDLREDMEEVLDIICASLMLNLSRDENNNYVITLK